MNKMLRFFLLIVPIVFLCEKVVSQTANTNINIICSWDNKRSENSIYKIYFNNSLVTSTKMNEQVNCKLYSEGRITIDIRGEFLTNGGLLIRVDGTTTLDVKAGNNYYIIKDFNQSIKSPYFKWHVADSTEWQTVSKYSSNSISLTENIQNPWGNIDFSKKSGKGQGSCFVISANGYLITNYHCIENAKEITVKGIDGDFTTKYGASVVASDPSNDLALLKIGNKNIKFDSPPFAIRSSGVAQAEKVYALGFPKADAMGQEVKITEGIISAKSGVGNDISKFQISAAVNPGNSGGPLIDEHGNLIGVIYAKSSIAESAGYAVKASYLETFLKNVDGFEFPVYTNIIKDKLLTERVAALKNFIFIVETS